MAKRKKPIAHGKGRKHGDVIVSPLKSLQIESMSEGSDSQPEEDLPPQQPAALPSSSSTSAGFGPIEPPRTALPTTNLQRSWIDADQNEGQASRERNEDVKVIQNPNFVLQFNPEVINAAEVPFTVDELEEGCNQWRHTLVGCVMGTEVSWSNMTKFVHSRWTHVSPPTITKQAGVFLFRFQSKEDMCKVYEALTYFIFDKPLILKKYEFGMQVNKEIFDRKPVWVRLPDLKMEMWTPKSISKIVSVFGNPLMADLPTIQKTRLSYARVLVSPHDPSNVPTIIKLTTPEGTHLQVVQYEWSPLPCKKCNKWGHQEEDCIPNYRHPKAGKAPQNPAPTTQAAASVQPPKGPSFQQHTAAQTNQIPATVEQLTPPVASLQLVTRRHGTKRAIESKNSDNAEQGPLFAASPSCNTQLRSVSETVEVDLPQMVVNPPPVATPSYFTQSEDGNSPPIPY